MNTNDASKYELIRNLCVLFAPIFHLQASTDNIDEDYIRGDIRSLVHSQPDQTFTGRAIARIMHGIASPNYPAQVWGRLRRVWRSHLEVDFPTLVRIANNEIVQWRMSTVNDN